MPGTPASLLWSLETTRHEPKKPVDVIVKSGQRRKLRGLTIETPVRHKNGLKYLSLFSQQRILAGPKTWSKRSNFFRVAIAEFERD